MIYVLHHAVTLVLAAAAARALTRGRWQPRAPRLALLLWHATVVSAVTGAVGLLLGLGLAPYGRGIAPALGSLVTDGAGHLTGAHIAAVAAGLLLAAAAVGVQAHSSWQLWRQRSRHRLLLRLVGRPDPHGRALLLEHPAAAAYYVPGPAGCVVISTGAVDALTERELAAVLAHEHAHARGRHHLVLAPFHAIRRVLPIGPVARAAADVELLVEMCADDHAARRHGPTPLTAALRRFHELGGHPSPAGTLAASEHAIALRIARLHGGTSPIHRSIRLATALAALAVATTPASLYVLPL
ncbi:peptidase M48-like protein [Pseudonocardia hierapolitana]|uniref:Peptidase M48-like protein n=1 Tax=Pseudonocardia hierapolitana TaxID=1128676 RepID=A0A561SX25_9PSEU|nr:M56 family metallopeptidase [Pseudonocardia hierapolitana]TWF79416.1 peptidase M48-like protein [Pseudonocardia hierapolitana]